MPFFFVCRMISRSSNGEAAFGMRVEEIIDLAY
jgi:hypothetical protein